MKTSLINQPNIGTLNIKNTKNAEAQPGFADHLKAAVNKTNTMQLQADDAMQALASGESGNIHETLIAMSKAETSFKMLTQVRNKILNAYQEVMRMQI